MLRSCRDSLPLLLQQNSDPEDDVVWMDLPVFAMTLEARYLLPMGWGIIVLESCFSSSQTERNCFEF